MENDESRRLQVLKEVAAAFNRHDLDTIMSYFAEAAILDMPRGPDPWGRRYIGKAAVREGLASRFAMIPDVHYGDDRHWVCGNLGVSEWLLTGTTTAGVRLEVRGCDHWEFRGNKILRKDPTGRLSSNRSMVSAWEADPMLHHTAHTAILKRSASKNLSRMRHDPLDQ